MSIPKVIHYCWFGRNPKPDLALKCIKSWKKHCPDYQIIEWNEDNFDISSCPLYVRQAYEVKKWAFVTDYVRLKVVYDHGGIYLDTDVELIKSPNELLAYSAFFGFEYGEYIATGLGFGSEKQADILREMMADYGSISFVRSDGSYDTLACPVRNTGVLLRRGLRLDNTKQIIDDALILPSEYLCPYDGRTGYLNKTENTVSIHWYNGSWLPSERRKDHRNHYLKSERAKIIDYILHIPNRMGRKIIGDRAYDRLKKVLKRKRD